MMPLQISAPFSVRYPGKHHNKYSRCQLIAHGVEKLILCFSISEIGQILNVLNRGIDVHKLSFVCRPVNTEKGVIPKTIASVVH